MLSKFSCTFWPFVHLWRNVYYIFCPFNDWVIWFLYIKLYEQCVLYILEINLLLVTSFANIFSWALGSLFIFFYFFCYVVIQSLSHIHLFVTPWAAAHQASLSFTISQSLLKLMSIELLMLSKHLIFCHPLLLLPSMFSKIKVFPNDWLFASGGQSIGASILGSVLPLNIQGWFILGLTGLISLHSKGLSRVLSSTTIWKHQFFGTQPSWWSNSNICTGLLEKP